MAFEFRLRHPPCDISFLAVVDAPVLYNAGGAANDAVKEATIRQIGWHPLHLPEEWFFSEKSRAMTERVCCTMQCTIQYLAHQQKKLEAEAAKTQRRLEEMQEERDEAFEELIELREVVALMKQRYGEGSRRGPTAAPAGSLSQVGRSGHSFTCSLCGNCYPSSSSLQSHVLKRHHRGQRYATMAAASVAIRKQVIGAVDPPRDALIEELTSLRSDVAFLRGAVAAECEKRREEAQSSFFSPINVVALPAHHLSASPAPIQPDGVLASSERQQQQQQQQQQLINALQDELQFTKSRLAHMGEALRHKEEVKRGGREKQASISANEQVEASPLLNTTITSAESKSCHPDDGPAAVSANSLVFYSGRCGAPVQEVSNTSPQRREAALPERQDEKASALHAVSSAHCLNSPAPSQHPLLLSLAQKDSTQSQLLAALEPERSESPGNYSCIATTVEKKKLIADAADSTSMPVGINVGAHSQEWSDVQLKSPAYVDFGSLTGSNALRVGELASASRPSLARNISDEAARRAISDASQTPNRKDANLGSVRSLEPASWCSSSSSSSSSSCGSSPLGGGSVSYGSPPSFLGRSPQQHQLQERPPMEQAHAKQATASSATSSLHIGCEDEREAAAKSRVAGAQSKVAEDAHAGKGKKRKGPISFISKIFGKRKK
ncbi:zinc finger protein [Trypanosoma grayi]|uniref:zinc finger protein n=1 Tax=Trypanosoma grayi TaxID=71804 RepID=UPI0004F49A05|nr:zinc finger protein [Trypanosoma grayi]KEG15616.1 zinc finger protein [Trypanosoma grayi]